MIYGESFFHDYISTFQYGSEENKFYVFNTEYIQMFIILFVHISIIYYCNTYIIYIFIQRLACKRRIQNILEEGCIT